MYSSATFGPRQPRARARSKDTEVTRVRCAIFELRRAEKRIHNAGHFDVGLHVSFLWPGVLLCTGLSQIEVSNGRGNDRSSGSIGVAVRVSDCDPTVPGEVLK
jgi:hypothetical protein